MDEEKFKLAVKEMQATKEMVDEWLQAAKYKEPGVDLMDLALQLKQQLRKSSTVLWEFYGAPDEVTYDNEAKKWRVSKPRR